MTKKSRLYSTAIHEAAHLVTQIMEPFGSTPDEISIVPDGEKLGYVSDPAYGYLLLVVDHPTREQITREVIKCLAGYTAESILKSEPYLKIASLMDSSDFLIAITLIERMIIGQEEKELLTSTVLNKLLYDTMEFLKTPAVWSAIQYVANKLLAQPVINRNNGLFDLIHEVFELPGFKDVRLISPDIDLLADTGKNKQ